MGECNCNNPRCSGEFAVGFVVPELTRHLVVLAPHLLAVRLDAVADLSRGQEQAGFKCPTSTFHITQDP
jgi:hypothetical protein